MKSNLLHFFALLSPLAMATKLHQLNLADLTKKAEQGNAIAHYQIGNMYQFGRGVPKDDANAFYWFKKSAEQGLNYDLLGTFYYHGIGTERNNEKAFENFIKAHQMTPKKANLQEQLGKMYEFGEGTPVDAYRAFDFYRQAAEQGKPYSQYRLAHFYRTGKVASQNLEMAEAYYRLVYNLPAKCCRNNVADFAHKSRKGFMSSSSRWQSQRSKCFCILCLRSHPLLSCI